MPTRFYLESDATDAAWPPGQINPTYTPAYDSAWNVTSSALRRWMTDSTQKMNTPVQNSTHAETSASTVNVLSRQFISGVLDAQTISGTVKGQIRVRSETSADADFMPQVVIRVVSNDGSTVRATLLSADTSALDGSEFPYGGNAVNRKFPVAAISPATLSSYTCVDGDRLVVEIGYRAHNATATSRTALFQWGSNMASDLPEDETDETEKNPWIEFSGALTFWEPERRITQVVGLTTGVLSPSERRISQVATNITGSYPSERRISSVAVLVAGKASSDHWGWTDISGSDSWQDT